MNDILQAIMDQDTEHLKLWLGHDWLSAIADWIQDEYVHRDQVDEERSTAYDEGYDVGSSEGYAEGYKNGVDDAKRGKA